MMQNLQLINEIQGGLDINTWIHLQYSDIRTNIHIESNQVFIFEQLSVTYVYILNELWLAGFVW